MLFTREKQEDLEEQRLAPYACLSRRSRGRDVPEEEPQYRTCYQRDRDRIIHTSAFRRLEHKTQVFITYEGDYYRTRLTHTLEVAQIGRSMAKALGANEDLVEAICLAHDLGHPPFGHSGEMVLSELMSAYGGFDHNRQSLRIVTHLERRYPQFPGLNLSWETREGIVKHETEYDKSDASGYDPEKRGDLEAQITNMADEFAFTAHDLDDGLRAGILPPEELEQLDLWGRLREAVGWKQGALDELTRHRMIRSFIGIGLDDILRETERRLAAHAVRTREDIQTAAGPMAGYSDELREPVRNLREWLFSRMYRHHRVIRMAVKAERVLSELFSSYAANPTILPATVQDRAAREDIFRVICDYIAGMTDRFALEEHRKLFDPDVLP